MQQFLLRISFVLLLGLSFGTMNAQQQYRYEVTTLFPAGTSIIDDGLCLDEKGTLYGSYWGIWQGAAGTHVAKYTPNLGSADTVAVGFTRPNGMSYRAGKIYLANSSESKVMSIDSLGNVEEITQILGGVSNVIPKPNSNHLTAVAWARRRVYDIDENGGVTISNESSLLSGPVGAAYDPQGNLYVGNFNDGRIIKVNGDQAEVFADLGGGIGFLTYSDGAILATNHSDKKVYRVDIATQTAEVIAGSGETTIRDGIGTAAAFGSPNGIVATPSGDTIYISEFSDKALRMIVRTPEVVSSNQKPLVEKDQVKLYPSPSNGKINFEYAHLEKVSKGVLRNSSGQFIREVTLAEMQNQILDFTNLSEGMYIFSLFDQQSKLITSMRVPIVK